MAARFGLLLPHFGANVRRARIVDASVEIERAGFDSVWVRDHVVFRPHGHEAQDPTFWEPLVTLAGVAAVTTRLMLGTGALIPFRHPIHTALLAATLDRLAEGDRLILGVGLGSFDHEFEAVGMGGWDRRVVIEEQVEILRRIWRGETVDHHGTFYSFEDVQVGPTPAAGDIPVWYSGTSAASVRRAVEYCQGWIPGRMPRRDVEKRMRRMRRLAGEAGKPVPTAGVIPYVAPGATMEKALAGLDISKLLVEMGSQSTPPESGAFETVADLDGALIAGPPDVIIEEVSKYLEVGIEHLVFDLRLRFDDWEPYVDLLAREVLPELRRLPDAAPATT
jgi:probable F420-dependent oxidoreductase